MNNEMNIHIKFPKIVFLDTDEEKNNDCNSNIIIDYTMEPLKHVSKKFLIEYPNIPPCINELVHLSTILSVAFIYHYFLGSPTHDENPIMASIANFAVNTIAEYLPKSIIEGCQTEIESFNNKKSDTIYREDIKNYIKKILEAINKYFRNIKDIIKNLQKRKIPISPELILLELCKNSPDSIYYLDKSPLDKDLKTKKASKLSGLLLQKLKQLSIENNKMHKIMMIMTSMISNITPLIVATFDNYFTPYTISIIFKRALIVLEENTEKINNVKNKGKKNKENNTSVPMSIREKELVKQYGSIINEICKTILSCLDLSIPAKVLAGSAKIGFAAFSNFIGIAICNALNPSVQSDIDKIKFFFRLFFRESSNNNDYDYESEIYDIMKEILKFEKAIIPIGDNISESKLIDNFYNEFPNNITNLIKSVNNIAGNVSKEIIEALTKFLRISFENQELLNIMIYDYLLPSILID